MIRGLLESEGIPAILGTEHHVWMKWPLSNALGGVRVQVSVSLAPRAREVLVELRNGEFEGALEAEFDLPRVVCPKCGSPDLRNVRSTSSALLAIASTFCLFIRFPPRIVGKRCRACGAAVEGAR